MKELDSDGSGSIDFNEFYDWFSNPSKRPGGNLVLKAMKLYLEAKNTMEALVGTKRKKQAHDAVLLKATQLTAREAQAAFRAVEPPRFECAVCHHSFALYRDFRAHFLAHPDRLKEAHEATEAVEDDANEAHAMEHAGHPGTVRPLSSLLTGRDRDRCSVKVEQRGDLFPDPVAGLVEQDRRNVAWRMYGRHRDEESQLERERERAYAATHVGFNEAEGKAELAKLKARLLEERRERHRDQKAHDMSKKRRHRADIEEAFHVFDLDGSGTIDRHEFAALVSMLGLPISEEAADDAMEEIDEDGSGEVFINRGHFACSQLRR